MIKVIYICELPPPFGGVTVKNKLLIDNLCEKNNINVIDMCECKRYPWKIPIIAARMAMAYILRRKIIYGFGSYERLNFALKVQGIIGGKKSLGETINIVMGGLFPQYLIENKRDITIAKSIKTHFVETVGMKEILKKVDVCNVEIFPNCRTEFGALRPKHNRSHKLKCVFFSQISADKGVDEIISAYSRLTSVETEKISIDFYGHISGEIKLNFDKFVGSFSNVKYNGVFDSTKSNVYEKLNEFDVILLPTKWIGEGVPGILVEAKMSGIVPIVSDFNYNAEIVRNDIEGIVISGNISEQLTLSLRRLLNDIDCLNRLKTNSYESRKRYSLEVYKTIIDQLIKVNC